MANIIDGICPEGSILDGFDNWPRSATRKEWFRITRELVASTIADMDLDPAAMAEVEEAFIGAGPSRRSSPRQAKPWKWHEN